MKEHHYFDNAATSWPKPEAVYRGMDEAQRRLAVNPGRSGYGLALEAEQLIAETRRLLAEFFGHRGDASRVVFALNATDALNTALFGTLRAGDHVVTTRLEHNSVLRPLDYLRRDHGVEVSYARADGEGYVDPGEVRRLLRRETRLVVVNHASNVLGSVQDVAAIGRIAHEVGALMLVDTCQSAGVVPIDAQAMGIDLLAFTGHKGLLGPMGSGGLVVAEGVEVRPVRFGGTGVDSHSPLQPEQYPWHLEAGTLNLPGIAGLNAAQKWLAALGRERAGDEGDALSHAHACRLGIERVASREREHLGRLDSGFRALEGVTVYGPATQARRVATLSVTVEGMPPEQVGIMLDADHHVCVRTGLHCAPLVHEDIGTAAAGTVRFAPGYFTDDEDLEQALAAMRAIAAA